MSYHPFSSAVAFFPDIRIAVKRFPLPIIFALLNFIFLISGLWLGAVGAFLTAGFFWSVTASLMAETLNWQKWRAMGVRVGGLFILALLIYIFDAGHDPVAKFGVMIFCFLSVFIAPCADFRNDDRNFWDFNRALWMTILSAVVLSVLLFAGLAAIMGSISYLFGIKFGIAYLYAWSLAAYVFAPVYVLAKMPDLRTQTQSHFLLPAQCAAQAYIIIPLFAAYAIILYVYAGKITAQFSLPKGGVAMMVAAFGLTGIGVYFLNYGVAGQKRIIDIFQKYFFTVLIVPLVLFAVALSERIYSYGVTEQRYHLLALLIFFAGAIALHVFSKRYELQKIYLFFTALVLTTVLTATQVSYLSQSQRLKTLLEQNHLLENGRLVPGPAKVSYDDRYQISSIIEYMASTKKLSRLTSWTGIQPNDNRQRIMAKMDLDFISSYDYRQGDEASDKGHRVNWYAQTPYNSGYQVSGYDYAAQVTNHAVNRKDFSQKISIETDKGVLDVILSKGEKAAPQSIKIAFANDPNLAVELDVAGKLASTQEQKKPIDVTAESATLKARLILKSYMGYIKSDGTFTLSSFEGTLLIKRK